MKKLSEQHRKIVYTLLNTLLFVLSVGLIVYLSIDAFTGVEVEADSGYMRFQFWVCLAFIADFFIELVMAEHKWSYVRNRILFLLLSVPYINICVWLGIDLSADVLYYARFIPLARCALAMSIVVGYVSRNRLTNIFASYMMILLAIVYFGSLILFEREHGVNPDMHTYMQALWMACSDATTTGSSIYPVTAAGKIVTAILATMGMVMFPLFTVMVTSAMQARISKSR